jgi:short-subunit dehydrogenase
MNRKIVNWSEQHIWLIGASSGIGRALAIELAQRGAHLYLSSRKKELLLELQQQFPNNISVHALDVLNTAEIQTTLNKFEKLDLVVCLAADYSPMTLENFDTEIASHMIDVNLKGALNISGPVLKRFMKEKKGHLSLVASIAGYIGLPQSSVYGATKAGLINFSESIYNEAKAFNIDISVINPGFVKTNLTAKNSFPMPFLMTPEEAALEIIKGFEKGKFAIVFPKTFSYFFRTLRILPYNLHLALIKKMVKV